MWSVIMFVFVFVSVFLYSVSVIQVLIVRSLLVDADIGEVTTS